MESQETEKVAEIGPVAQVDPLTVAEPKVVRR